MKKRNKWKHRSIEDKKRILAEQEKNKEEKQQHETYGRLGPKRNVEVYEQGNIPMICPTHGWVGSLKYKIILDIHPLFPSTMNQKNVEMLIGNCLKCNKGIKRAIPSISFEEIPIFTLTASNLKKVGRLIDRRN